MAEPSRRDLLARSALHGLHRAAARPHLRRLSWRLAVVVLALVGAGIGLTLAGSVTTTVGPVHAKFALRPSASMSGGTTVEIPPLGSLRLATDRAPVQLRATVLDIDTQKAQALVNDPARIQGLQKPIVHDVSAAVVAVAIRAALAALVGACLLTFVVTRQWRATLAAGVLIFVATLTTGGVAYSSWNTKALAEPKYSGLLSRAPTVVGNVQDVVTHFDKYSTQLAKLVTNVSRLYGVTSTLPEFAPSENNTIAVLHISDIHDNPEAWDVVSSISRQFSVDFIIDTGDISDHGSDADNELADIPASITRLGKPYIFIKGNHDSYGSTTPAVSAAKNAILLDNSATTIDGLRIYGAPDPRFTPDMTTADTNDDEQKIYQDGVGLADRVIAATPPKIDIVLVHDPGEGRPLDGEVPLVLAGHLHKRDVIQLKGGTLLFVEGSTGGAGLRALDHGVPTPLEASVLYFSKTTRRLVAYDEITLGGLGLTSVSVERHFVHPPATRSPASSAPASAGTAVSPPPSKP